MKRAYIAVLFLLVSISLCVFEQYTVNTTYKEATEYIDKALEYAEKEDYASAEQTCKELNNYWISKSPYLTAMIDHGPLDETGITIGALEDMAKNKSDGLEDELITAKNQIKSIRENQKVSFGNVF